MSASVAGLAAYAASVPLAAQAVVQPLPPREAGDLNDALQRLARSPRDIGALLDAGEASLVVGDIDAAIGFFARAQDLEPGNGRMLLGLARAFTLQRQPIEALRLYAEAEKAGIPEAAMAADRGLAFDLVGDNASAQALYRVALAQGNDPETRRRLALSLAMTGQRQEFEAMLFPLLEAKDRSSFRARAFGLAILGDADDAVEITEALMPADLALRMAPYLRYMPRLTRAQQAAAANLGAFPRASEIGRDGSDIAGYAPVGGRVARGPDAALAPRGAPMGQPTSVAAPAVTPAPAQVAPPPAPTQTPAPAPAPAPAPSEPELPAATPPGPALQPAAVVVAQAPAEQTRFDLSRIDPADPTADVAGSAAAPVEIAAASPAFVPADPDPEPSQSVADAFAAFAATQPMPTARPGNAVDITTITPPRERAEPPPPKPEAKPAPPANLSRHYVQVATGRDRDALKFDWRRISRNADSLLDGKGPFVTKWVEANRLLAGPYPSAAAAREVMNKLKAIGIDSFTFTSDAGQAIDKLD